MTQKQQSPWDEGASSNKQTGDNGCFAAGDDTTVNNARKSPLSALKKLSATNRLRQMESNMRKEDFIFQDLALSGQLSVFIAQPGCGKTLFFLHLIIQAINDGKVNPSDVFYINADDNYAGLLTKTRIAKEHGFQMISPSEADIEPGDIIEIFTELARSGEADGIVIILDTLKKFANMMDKRSQARLYKVLRSLNAKGATVIIAGHANKHLSPEGKLIYEGTSDTLNDIDCMYLMYRLGEKSDENQVIEFINEKDRGSNIHKVIYGYTKRSSPGYTYHDLLRSVHKLDDDSARQKSDEARILQLRQQYENEILFVEMILTEHSEPVKQKVILDAHTAKEYDVAERFGRNKLIKALQEMEGITWKANRTAEKNAIYYEIITQGVGG